MGTVGNRKPRTTPSGERIYSLRETATVMGLRYYTVRGLADSGALTTFTLTPGGRYRYILESEVERYMRRGQGGGQYAAADKRARRHANQ